MNSFLHIDFDDLAINTDSETNLVVVRGEVAHAHTKIKQIVWFGDDLVNPWIMFGFETRAQTLRSKLLQPQARYAGFYGLCEFSNLDNLGFEVHYEDGKSEIALFRDYQILFNKCTEAIVGKVPVEPGIRDIVYQGIAQDAETVIILPTYKPDLGFLFEQVDSIRTQSYTAWHCLIVDDCSNDDFSNIILRLVGDDKRFTICQNSENMGFYHNIEYALTIVENGFLGNTYSYIALADQDDFWYPSKLEKSIAWLKENPEEHLVFCDQDITNENLKVLQESFWLNRSMDIERLDKLLLKNSVTGAAVLFKSDLLGLVLPFPRSLGKMYHDHWLGLCALLGSSIGYVSESLYAYRQHSSQDTGYGDVNDQLNQRIQNSLNRAHSMISSESVGLVTDRLSLDILSHDVLRMAVLARAMQSRFYHVSEEKKTLLNIFSLKEPQDLFDYLKSETQLIIENTSTSPRIPTMAEEVYLLASAMLAGLNDGQWQKIKVVDELPLPEPNYIETA